MRILIVEDNEITAGIIDSNLRQRNYETLVAKTGTEGLDLLENHWDVALVIADIMLPDLDGLELTRRMKENPKWQGIPVIVCTSSASAEHVSQAAKLGCRNYLLKPIDRVKLLMMVDRVLAGQKPVLGDPAKIAEKFGLSLEALDGILQAFSQLVDESITALTPGTEKADAPARIDLAKLSEGAVTFRAERLLETLRAFQSKGAEPPTPDECGALRNELTTVQRALSARRQGAHDPKPSVAPSEGKAESDEPVAECAPRIDATAAGAAVAEPA